MKLIDYYYIWIYLYNCKYNYELDSFKKHIHLEISSKKDLENKV